jgi:hypothetical protein
LFGGRGTCVVVSSAIVTCLDNLSVFITSGDDPAAHANTE